MVGHINIHIIKKNGKDNIIVFISHLIVIRDRKGGGVQNQQCGNFRFKFVVVI